MIILNQYGNEYINFDNVARMFLSDMLDSNLETIGIIINVKLINHDTEIIGEFQDIEYGKEVFQDLLMDYRGNSVIEVPKDREVKTKWKRTGTH